MTFFTDSAGNCYNASFKRVLSSAYPDFTFYTCAYTGAEFRADIEEIFSYLQGLGNVNNPNSFAYKPFGSANSGSSIFNTRGYQGWFLRFSSDSEFSGAIPSNLGFESSKYVQNTNSPTVTEVDWINDYTYNANWSNVVMYVPGERRFTLTNTGGANQNDFALFDESLNHNILHQTTYKMLNTNPYENTKYISLSNEYGVVDGQHAIDTNLGSSIPINIPSLNYKALYTLKDTTATDEVVQFRIKPKGSAPFGMVTNKAYILFTLYLHNQITTIAVRYTGSAYNLLVRTSTFTISSPTSLFPSGGWDVWTLHFYNLTATNFYINGVRVGTASNTTTTPQRFAITEFLHSSIFVLDDIFVIQSDYYNSRSATNITPVLGSTLVPSFTTQKSARLWLPELEGKTYVHTALKVVSPDTPQKGYICHLQNACPAQSVIVPLAKTGYSPLKDVTWSGFNALCTINSNSVARLWFHKIPYTITGDTPNIWFHYVAKLEDVNNLPNMLPVDSYVTLHLVSQGRTSDISYYELSVVCANRVNVLNNLGQSGGVVPVKISGTSDEYRNLVRLHYRNGVNIANVAYPTNTPASYLGAVGTGYVVGRAINANVTFTLTNTTYSTEGYSVDNIRTLDFWWMKTVSTGSVTVTCNTFNAMSITITNTGVVNLSIGGTAVNSVATLTIPLSVWQHIALVQTEGELMLYQNGVLRYRGTFTPAMFVNTTFLTVNVTSGFVDEVRYTSTARWITTAIVGTQVFNPPTYEDVLYPIACADGQTPRGFNQSSVRLWATDLYVLDHVVSGSNNVYVGRCPNLLYGHDGIPNTYTSVSMTSGSKMVTGALNQFVDVAIGDTVQDLVGNTIIQNETYVNSISADKSQIELTKAALSTTTANINVTEAYIPLKVYKFNNAATGGASPYFICIGKQGSQGREAILMRCLINNESFV